MNQIFKTPAPSSTLDIDILRSVVAIAEGGSIVVAATRVARTPAAVSMQIKKLEEMLGRTLFERTRSGMTLTAEGEQLLDYARRMIDLNRAAMQAFSMPELEGEVSIGLIDSFGGLRLADVFAAFARSHPKVTVNISMASTMFLAPQLDAGALDLSLITPDGCEPLRETDIVLHEEPLAWLALQGGRAIRERPIPLAVANDGCAWRKLATESIEGHGLEARIAYTSDFDQGQLAAVKADLAVAPMPRGYLERGLVEIGAREGLPPLGKARIVLRMGETASGAARALAERIAETYGKHLTI